MDGIVLRTSKRSPGLVDSKRSSKAFFPVDDAERWVLGVGQHIRQHRDVDWFNVPSGYTVAEHRLVVDFNGERTLSCQSADRCGEKRQT